MTPEQFVAKWANTTLSEKASAHEHFIDLCNLIGHPPPASDPPGQDYTFEKPVHPAAAASRGSKGDLGYVDVWKRGHFAWEYKRKDKYKDLTEAYRQLYQYRDDLDNPPLSVVCDINTTEIHTHFTGYPKRKIAIALQEIPARLHEIRRVFTDPNSFIANQRTTTAVTQEVADEFATLANNLINRYVPLTSAAFHGEERANGKKPSPKSNSPSADAYWHSKPHALASDWRDDSPAGIMLLSRR